MKKRQWQWILLLFCMMFVGCMGAAGGSLRGFVFALVTAFLFAMACVQVAPPGGEKNNESTTDGSVNKDDPGSDKTADVADQGPDGAWESCCKDGKISKCFCPAGAACNYGQYQDCGNGTCLPDPTGSCEPVSDAGPDATPDKTTDMADQGPDGTWQACCENGKISKCFCPSGVACNYGQYQDCGSGTCVPDPTGSCEPAPDAGPDAKPEPTPETKPEPVQDGTWQACCDNGKISKCFCPSGVACNYGQYQDCGNGTCVGPVGTCEPVPEKKPEPIPEAKPEPMQDGTWQACCKSGKVDKCFCPSGLACNYGWYKDCGNGVCVPDPSGMCP